MIDDDVGLSPATLPTAQRFASAAGVFVPFLGLIVAVYGLWGWGVTWSINSVCHLWGSRPFDRGDQSRNNFVFGVLGLGEGWHNNHHAFPSSARHGLRWWQLDLSYLAIRALELIGLARRVRVPARERTVTKRNEVGVRYELT